MVRSKPPPVPQKRSRHVTASPAVVRVAIWGAAGNSFSTFLSRTRDSVPSPQTRAVVQGTVTRSPQVITDRAACAHQTKPALGQDEPHGGVKTWRCNQSDGLCCHGNQR